MPGFSLVHTFPLTASDILAVNLEIRAVLDKGDGSDFDFK